MCVHFLKLTMIGILIMVFFFAGFILASPAGQGSLAEVYRTGKVRLVPDLIIDEKSSPKNVPLVAPIDVAVDSNGNIFVLDISENNIKEFDALGKFLRVLGRKGQGPGEFNSPSNLACVGDRLAVLDTGNLRLCIMGLDGVPISCTNVSAFSGYAQKIRALPSGDFVLETEKSFFGAGDKPQECRLEILGPELKSKKTIYFHPVNRYRYLKLNQGATNLPTPFLPNVYWDVTPAGKIVIGFSEKYEVGIYDNGGTKTSTLARPYDPAKVTDNDKKEFFDGSSMVSPDGTIQKPPDFIVKNIVFPRVKPAFDDLVVDSEGNIWVHSCDKNIGEEKKSFDVFTNEGEFINHVKILGDANYPYRARIINKHVWSIETDKEGFFKVIGYKIST